ncbi:MAG TPA: FtsX-like permease family protein [Opitutaceae bacterium]|nr:FtsX-like permease family protein [Opitutaceae bacterium]
MTPWNQRVPVAWCMLLHRKGRFLLSMLGIAFSVVIMFMEIGFSNGINDSQARLPVFLNADLVLLHKARTNLLEGDRLNRIRMQQALACDEVVSAVPLYEGLQLVVNPDTNLVRVISVLAFPPRTTPLKLPELDGLTERLGVKGNVLFDRLSRPVYGTIREGTQLTIGDQPTTVVGFVGIGPSIRSDGYVLMGNETWDDSKAGADLVSMALLKVKPGTDLDALKTKLLAQLGEEITVLTPEELREREVYFTAHATPAGGVFAVGLSIGFLIGMIICYQILFNEISDNMPQYATVKAVGFSKSYLVVLVMQQAVLLAVFGFLPGLAGGAVLYFVIQRATQILMFLTWQRAGFIFVLTLFMCAVSGLLAVRKVLRADPAEVF